MKKTNRKVREYYGPINIFLKYYLYFILGDFKQYKDFIDFVNPNKVEI